MVYGFVRTNSTTQDGTTRAQLANVVQTSALTRMCVDCIIQGKTTDELLSLIGAGDIVAVYSLGALGNTFSEIENSIKGIISRKTRLITIQEEFNSETVKGKYCIGILRELAEIDKSSRTRVRKTGRPPVDPLKIDVALSMYRSGDYTVKQISEIMGFSHSTLYSYLKKS